MQNIANQDLRMESSDNRARRLWLRLFFKFLRRVFFRGRITQTSPLHITALDFEDFEKHLKNLIKNNTIAEKEETTESDITLLSPEKCEKALYPKV